MKTYEVVLTKSYVVKIKVENKQLAKEYSQFYTSDISTQQEQEEKRFEIEEIDCKTNEMFDKLD